MTLKGGKRGRTREKVGLKQLQGKIAASKFAAYLQSPDLNNTKLLLRAQYAQRENARRQDEDALPVLDGRQFVKLTESGEAKAYAATIIARITEAAESQGFELCELQPIVINGLPGGRSTPAAESAALGLVREDGLISPVAINHQFILTQGDGTFQAGRYDENTDFQALFRDQLTPKSFV